MLKEERFEKILTLVNQKGTVKVNEIMDHLDVSDMTVRRDLTELDRQKKLRKIHGGAQSLHSYKYLELSHTEKKILNIDEKQAIVKTALSLINDEDTIFLGPGTTIELLAEQIDQRNLKVVTNSLPVFNHLIHREDIKLYLLGGAMRQRTNAFYGELANVNLAQMFFHKAFISCNAIEDGNVMTASFEEGQTQTIAFNNSQKRFLLADTSKLNQRDFYAFYQLDQLSAVVMNQDPEQSYLELAEQVKVITEPITKK